MASTEQPRSSQSERQPSPEGARSPTFDRVIERLAHIPDVLPPPPAVLMPVRTDAVEARRRIPLDELTSARPAAVLVLVVPGEDDEALVVLTERVDRGGHHSGEVSFPGGSLEPSDGGPVEAALREANEEVALDAAAAGVRVAGLLEPFWIPVSNFTVTPVLAIADRMPFLVAQPDEVARILLAPVSAFVPDAPIEIVERVIRDWPLRYGGYRIDGLHVWGATARILGQLGALVAG